MEITNMTPSLEDVLEKALEEVNNLTPENEDAYELAVKNLQILYEIKREQEKAEEERVERNRQRRRDWFNDGLNGLKFIAAVGFGIWKFVKTDFWKRTSMIFEEKGSFSPATRENMKEMFPDIKF